MPNFIHLAMRQGCLPEDIEKLADLVMRWKHDTRAALCKQVDHLRKIYVHLPERRPIMEWYGNATGPASHKSVMGILGSFAEMDSRVVLLNPPQEIIEVFLSTAFAMWIDSADGLDPWWEE